MEKSTLAFGKLNYIILSAGIVLIILGFILMSESGSTEEQFNPEIFSARRIAVAPMVSLAGFIVVIAGILAPKKK